VITTTFAPPKKPNFIHLLPNMPSLARLALAVAPFVLVARADISDFELDDDVPTECRDICRPVAQLADRCDVNLNDRNLSDNDEDRWEDLLEAQCFCAHSGFDVEGVTALCASCMQQYPNPDDDDDDDNLEDINDIMRTCSFSSTSFAPSATSVLQGITVSATAPTATSQLTTTVGSGSAPTGDAGGNDNNNGNSDDNDSLGVSTAQVSGGLMLTAAAIGFAMMLL
jgi:hypothetical protein